MRFLVFDGEVINVGSIQEINFEASPGPRAETLGSDGTPSSDSGTPSSGSGTPSDPSTPSGHSSGDTSGNASGRPAPTHGRAPGRKPFSGPHHDPAIATLPRDRARILVLGRSEPLETSDPQRIARLRELWRAKRAVGA